MKRLSCQRPAKSDYSNKDFAIVGDDDDEEKDGDDEEQAEAFDATRLSFGENSGS